MAGQGLSYSAPSGMWAYINGRLCCQSAGLESTEKREAWNGMYRQSGFIQGCKLRAGALALQRRRRRPRFESSPAPLGLDSYLQSTSHRYAAFVLNPKKPLNTLTTEADNVSLLLSVRSSCRAFSTTTSRVAAGTPSSAERSSS